MTTTLLHELVTHSAARAPQRIALTSGIEQVTYGALADRITAFAAGLVDAGLGRGERVGIYLDKRVENVIACFGAAAAGAVFVPLNPLLKAEQVGYILRNCNVRVLVTSVGRLDSLRQTLGQCPDLRLVIRIGEQAERGASNGVPEEAWTEIQSARPGRHHPAIDVDMVAILYTSGSTGKPKGVMLSHRNMVAGAKSVAEYLENNEEDTLLSVLPLSFDAGFSQLTTAFHVGARVALLDYLLPRDVLTVVARERVTGLTAVPPLWIQLSRLQWPAAGAEHLRYIANTGGHMPRETLNLLRASLPASRVYLMYGLTEAFRSTYLPPAEVDRRPESIGKAIPNAEILVLRDDGSPCAPNEPGELVHRGALVSMGYWNDPEKTAERFRPLPGRELGFVQPEIAVFSGDTVRADEDGYLYFVSRRDSMIKTSGYRVSPTEIEEVLYSSQLVGEAAALGVPHPTLGQAIVVAATPAPGCTVDEDALLAVCRARLPTYMVPSKLQIRRGSLPRNPNGKIDRNLLASEFGDLFHGDPT